MTSSFERRYATDYPGLVRSWDQRKTLRPPPYQFAWKKHVEEGVAIGDPKAAQDLSDSDLMCGHPGYGKTPTNGRAKKNAADKDTSKGEKNSNNCQASDAKTVQNDTDNEFLETHEPPCFLGDFNDKTNKYLPPWVDFEAVTRGQRLWNKHLLRAAMSLGMSLLVGLSVARFSEILEYSGYSSSPMAAILRYRQTFFRWLDWFRFEDVKGADSRFRKSAFAVRKVHEFVRRKAMQQENIMMTNSKNSSTSTNDVSVQGAVDISPAATSTQERQPRKSKRYYNEEQEKNIGIPLSQYDVAEVQLVFSGLCISIFEAELSFNQEKAKLSKQDKEDMVHCWRFIGYLLGIQDDYNVCESVEKMNEYLEEFLVFMPQRLNTARNSAFRLRDAAITGFGWWSGLGVGFYKGMFLLACESERLMGGKKRIAVKDSTNSPVRAGSTMNSRRSSVTKTPGREDSQQLTDGQVNYNIKDEMIKSPWKETHSPTSRVVEDSELSTYTDCAGFGDVLWHRELVRFYLRYICSVTVRPQIIGKQRDLQFTNPELAWKRVQFNCKFAKWVDFLFWQSLRSWACVGSVGVAASGAYLAFWKNWRDAIAAGDTVTAYFLPKTSANLWLTLGTLACSCFALLKLKLFTASSGGTFS